MTIWEEFLSQLENKLGRDTVDRWVRPLKLSRFDAANIYLEAPDSFHIAWFEEHARPLAKKLVGNNGRPIKVHLGQMTKKPFLKEAPSFSLDHDPIDPEMTLECFIVHRPPNGIARNLINEAEKSPFNPLLLYGPTGAGKTHLLMAAAARFKERGIKAIYVRAETFTSHVVQGIRKGTMQLVRAAYRSAGALLVDDIHVFARKDATQEEFFHTFNELHTRGCPILLSSQFPPAKLTEIEPRLVSRFEWGISVGIEKEEEAAILKKKAEVWKLTLDPDLIPYLTHHFPSSPLMALQALALRGQNAPRLTPALASLLLKDLLAKESANSLTPEKIVKALAAHFGIRPADILGKSQTREAALPRQIAMYLCREKLKLPFQKIGELFGRDHSTVMSSVRSVQEGIEKQKPDICEALNCI